MGLTKKDLEMLSQNPIEYFKSLTPVKRTKVFKALNDAYYNSSTPIVSDAVFDQLSDLFAENKDVVGAEPKKNKIALPVYMGSLSKANKNDDTLARFLKKHTKSNKYFVSEKLDGVSALFIPSQRKLYTRGNGKVGEDISHLIDYINGLQFVDNDMYIRGELLLSKSNFDKSMGSNPRNTVSGIVNATKNVNVSVAKKIDFLAYDYISKKNITQEDSLNKLKNDGFKTPIFVQLDADDVTFESMTDMLLKWKKRSKYDIDGLVIKNDDDHIIKDDKFPKYAIAFKYMSSEETAIVKVKLVEWNESKDGLLKPLIRFDPVSLNGVIIQKTTGFNASYIMDNKIGPGSVLEIKRSGDVIPHIVKVIKASPTGFQMPEVDYVWKNKDIEVAKRESNVSTITNFFSSLDIKGVGPKMSQKIFENGFDTPEKIINMGKSEFLMIDGFKNKEELYDHIMDVIKKADCIQLMNASNVFGPGFGIKKLTTIINAIGYSKLATIQYDDLIKINGVSGKTAEAFIDGYNKFKEFEAVSNIKCKYGSEKKTLEVENSSQEVIVFSGIRDKALEAKLESKGHRIATTVSKNTTMIIVKDVESSSSKVQKAKDMGIKVVKYADIKIM